MDGASDDERDAFEHRRGEAGELVAGAIVDGRYELVRPIGAGASGAVWEAVHSRLTKRVALKFLDPAHVGREVLLERFRYEAQISARLAVQTSNIVAVHDVGLYQGRHYIVMDYASGASVEERLARGPMQLEEVHELLRQVGGALRVAHRAGIVHRDVKPANIVIATALSATPPIFKLTDFGVAKPFGPPLSGTIQPRATLAGMAVGSPVYMSPEQLEAGAVDGAADIWALAVIAYEGLSGELPFEGGTLVQLATNIIDGAHAPISTFSPLLPGGLDAFFAKAFQAEAVHRFRTVDSLLDGFATALTTAPATGSPCAAARVDSARGERESPGLDFASRPVQQAWVRAVAPLALATIGAACACTLAAILLVDQDQAARRQQVVPLTADRLQSTSASDPQPTHSQPSAGSSVETSPIAISVVSARRALDARGGNRPGAHAGGPRDGTINGHPKRPLKPNASTIW